jgi:hypothetical protein
MEQRIIWETLDQIKDEKSSDWFWIVGIIAIAGAILAIFFNNLLLGLLILLSAFASFILANTPPKIEEYELNRKGVRIGSELYPYSTLESFYVIDEDGFERDRILLKSKKTFMPLIVIPLGNEIKVDEVRDYLLDYVVEEEMTEPLSYYIMTLLGF